MRNRTMTQPKNAADSAGLERFIVELEKTRGGVARPGSSKGVGPRQRRHLPGLWPTPFEDPGRATPPGSARYRRGGVITDSVIPWGQDKVYVRRRMRHVSS